MIVCAGFYFTGIVHISFPQTCGLSLDQEWVGLSPLWSLLYMYTNSIKNILASVITNNVTECGHCLLFQHEWIPFDQKCKAASSHGLLNPTTIYMPTETEMGLEPLHTKKPWSPTIFTWIFSSSWSINAFMMVVWLCLISRAWTYLFLSFLSSFTGHFFENEICQSSHLVIAGNTLLISLCISFIPLLIHACVSKIISILFSLRSVNIVYINALAIFHCYFYQDYSFYALLFITCSTFSRLFWCYYHYFYHLTE